MMKVQSFGCQPLKPSYQLNSKPTFGNGYDDYEYEDAEIIALKREKMEMEKLAHNKDSKFLSTVGTLGVGAAAGAISFLTFKTVAPKGWNALKATYNKISSWGWVKNSAKFIKEKTLALGGKIAKAYDDIKPNSNLGKVKTFITDKFNWTKNKMEPVTQKVKSWYASAKNYVTKNKESINEGAKNTGATLVAIPASVTAINSDLKKEEGGED